MVHIVECAGEQQKTQIHHLKYAGGFGEATTDVQQDQR
jgi:hypothetical protein